MAGIARHRTTTLVDLPVELVDMVASHFDSKCLFDFHRTCKSIFAATHHRFLVHHPKEIICTGSSQIPTMLLALIHPVIQQNVTDMALKSDAFTGSKAEYSSLFQAPRSGELHICLTSLTLTEIVFVGRDLVSFLTKHRQTLRELSLIDVKDAQHADSWYHTLTYLRKHMALRVFKTYRLTYQEETTGDRLLMLPSSIRSGHGVTPEATLALIESYFHGRALEVDPEHQASLDRTASNHTMLWGRITHIKRPIGRMLRE